MSEASNLPIWRQCPELMARLRTAQNHPANIRNDIMSFAGFCGTEGELLAHVMHAELAALLYVEPVKSQKRRAA